MFRVIICSLLAALLLVPATSRADVSLLNASYDVTREFYKDFNAAFSQHWKDQTGEAVTINLSHGGSTKQARAVIDGLPADVVTMNQSPDIDAVRDLGKLIRNDWRSAFPHDSAPYYSTIVFLVRKGNPKSIHDWNDLIRPGVSVVVPNPKTSGNGRYSYLAAWAHAARQSNKDDAKTRAFIRGLFNNVPVLDTGGRGATTTFDARGIGDVLLTFEAEAHLIEREVGAGKYEIVIPSLSIKAEAPVAVVDKVVDQRGTRKVATAYLDYHFSEAGQELIAKNYFRPQNEAILTKYRHQFPPVNLFRIEEELGDWKTIQQIHFADGGVFDQLYNTK